MLPGHIIDTVLNSLDSEAGTDQLAREAFQSRANFYRLFQALVKENPGAMRRRILLERAAWQLAGTRKPVTEIGLDAQYSSLEAFARAFRKYYRVSPGIWRRSGSVRIHLPSPNNYHFVAPDSSRKGTSNNMNLFELFAGADAWYTRRLLAQAETLSDHQLDCAVDTPGKFLPWDKPHKNLREILERIVETKEVWTAALTGGEMPAMEGGTPAELLARFERAEADFQRILCDVSRRGAWDETFVDALCEPAETFTHGGMFAHIITFNTYRRLTALEAFDKLGVKIQGAGCPSEYEAAMGKSFTG